MTGVQTCALPILFGKAVGNRGEKVGGKGLMGRPGQPDEQHRPPVRGSLDRQDGHDAEGKKEHPGFSCPVDRPPPLGQVTHKVDVYKLTLLLHHILVDELCNLDCLARVQV